MSDINEYQNDLNGFLCAVGTNEIYSQLCSCGAITMSCYGDNTLSLSFKAESLPFIRPTNDIVMCNCNHCSNNWGIDIEPTQNVLTKTGWEDLTESETNKLITDLVEEFDQGVANENVSDDELKELNDLIEQAREVDFY